MTHNCTVSAQAGRASGPLRAEDDAEQDILRRRATGCAHGFENFPLHECVHQLFEEQAERTPEAIGVASENERWTFGQLNQAANQLARRLRALGIGSETPVAICLNRTPRMLAGLLGILKAGGAYVPLDPTHPAERLNLILRDSGAAIVLTETELIQYLPAESPKIFNLDSEAREIAIENADNLDEKISSDNLMYVIYTSGSTGKPKGVELPHRCVTNFLSSMQRELKLAREDVVLGLTTLSFDIAGLELFLPLVTGARVFLTDSRNAADPERLAKIIERSGATLVQTVPTVWRGLVDVGWRGERLQIICGGEALPRRLANELVTRAKMVWNAYGPTETAIWSLLSNVRAGEGPVSIGKPIANTTVCLLDEDRRPTSNGKPGELCIGGVGVARGYRKRPELTAEKFIPNPINPAERVYRTGDIVRPLPNGEFEFLGRADFQVKVRGHRIELGEIEAALCAHESVSEAVVVSAKDASEQAILVAYVKSVGVQPSGCPEAAANRELQPGALRQFLKARLPDYMLPSIIMTLEKFPLTPNGKIDRKALPEPKPERIYSTKNSIAPRNPAEETLAAIWRDVLGVERVGVHDNFFDLGGHSLSLAQIVARVRRTFRVELPLKHFFESPTVAALADILSEHEARDYRPISKTDSALSSEDLIQKLNELSDEEVEALLDKVLAAQPIHS